MELAVRCRTHETPLVRRRLMNRIANKGRTYALCTSGLAFMKARIDETPVVPFMVVHSARNVGVLEGCWSG